MDPKTDSALAKSQDAHDLDHRAAERAGFERARIENLFHFASLTPDQRVQWLVDTLAIMAEIQRAKATKS